MNFYVCIVILTVLLMIAMTLHVFRYSGFTKNQKTWYILTFLSIMVCSLAEYAVHCGYYDKSFKFILTVLTVIQFSLAPLLGVLFIGALGLKHQKKIAIGFIGINLFVEILSAPFGWIFYYTDEGYFRGEYFTIYMVFYFISLLYLIICMVIVGKKFSHRDMPTIIMVLVILVAGIIPMSFYRINVTYMAIAISSSVCYIYYNDLVQQDIQVAFTINQKRISSMQEHIISGLANLIENRDMETGEHITRTSRYVKTLAELARKEGLYVDKINDEFIDHLFVLAPLHDIGKILVSDTILKKPGKLTSEEYEEMKKHAALGGSVVREVLNGITDEEYLSFAEDIATYHHERWDGSGYPKGLKGEEIPLSARIMAIADVFDALISERCYKKAYPAEEAFKIISEESGSHFDSKLVDIFLKNKDLFL
ncbi:MAG: HD domain-containing protein [Acholeplasmatales bacterium]|nr:HD domain-containing protein [Acholeplasmatales bacterium]